MRRRYGEVEDEVDLGISQERIHADGTDAIFAGAPGCQFRGNVGASPQFHTGEERRIAQIGHRYVAAADDADAELVL